MDVAPETPPEAGDAANQLVGQFCGINECGIHTLLYRAARADAEANKVFEGAVVGESTLFDNERYQRAFGYSLALEAVGHGVPWFDDHADYDITLPNMPFEFTADEVRANTHGESLPYPGTARQTGRRTHRRGQ